MVVLHTHYENTGMERKRTRIIYGAILKGTKPSERKLIVCHDKAGQKNMVYMNSMY